MPVPDHRILATAFLLLGGLACAPRREAEPPRASDPRLDHLEAEVSLLEDRLRAHAPSGGRPGRIADGRAQRIDQRALREEPRTETRADCPQFVDTFVRAAQGSSCADYQSEMAVWAQRCVAECDPQDLALRAVRAGMAACSAWCTERECGRASFVPPAAGCLAGGCQELPRKCKSKECPLFEHCSLIDNARLWTCFCRDMVIQ